MTPPSSDFVEFPRSALDEPVAVRFETQAARHRDRVAITGPRHALTYAELSQAVDRVARAVLDRRGPRPERIALLAEHGAPAVVAILAALKTGKVYVPLDAHQPSERLAATLDDAAVELIVCDAPNRARARELAPAPREVLDATAVDPPDAALPRLSISPFAPACIYYTSGSSGEPKGVVWSHRGLLHRVLVLVNTVGLGPGDRVSLLHSVSVSASIRNMFGALLTGATLCPLALSTAGPGAIARWLAEERITILGLSASVFRHFAAPLTGAARFPAVRWLWVGSEPVLSSDIELHRRLFAGDCRLINGMATSEAGTVRQLVVDRTTPVEEGVLPVGYALPDQEVLLLGDDGAEVGSGEVGEIAVRSEFLALGYWGRPDLDAKVFAPDPAGGPRRVCRTGDLGRMLPDGCLLHLGRKDVRARLRGRFVHTAAVEQALLEDPAVAEAAVMVREDRPGDQRLVAYVVAPAAVVPSIGALRRLVGAKLGEAMAPSAFVFLEAFPRTPNGKIDRRALPAPGRKRPALAIPCTRPRTSLEKSLARIWAAALDLEEVGIHDDFLDLGGTSLHAGRITSQVCERLGVEIPPQTILEAPRVADMATAILQHLLAAVAPETRDRMLAALESVAADRPPPPAPGNATGA